MPLIDVSGVLTSPFFIDSFAVTRNQVTVGSNGRSVVTPTAISNLYGVVYPSSDNERKMLPDLSVQQKTVTVITRYALRGESQVAGTQFQPDVVVWNGDNYLVRIVEDWSRYGPGFVMAVCSSIDAVDMAPVTE